MVGITGGLLKAQKVDRMVGFAVEEVKRNYCATRVAKLHLAVPLVNYRLGC